MINNDKDPIFLSNLVKSCKNNDLIREDGKNLTIFNRITDLFIKRHHYDHFKSACEKLAQVSAIPNAIESIQLEDRIEILGRFREIQIKIKNQTTKNACDIYIKQFEDSILKKEDLSQSVQDIFNKINSASKSCNKFKRDRNIRNLNAIVDFYAKDKNGIGTIVTAWCDFLTNDKNKPKSKKSIVFLNETNHKVIKKLLDAEEKILSVNNDNQDINFISYPDLFSKFLKLQLKNPNKKEITDRISVLKNLMEKNSNNPQFIQNCIKNIHQFLANDMFNSNSNLSLSEMMKNDLLKFGDFFSIIDKHLPSINDKKLVLDLKVKCANLPCPTARSSFPNLYLSEKHQLDILVESLQRKENEVMDSLCEFLKANNPPHRDVSRVTKLVSEKSQLSHENRHKLRDALNSRLKPDSPEDWEDYQDVKGCLEKSFLLNPGQTSQVSSLKRISKAKKFFQDQVGLEENMILIPRWYHATNQKGITGILTSGEIQVRHEKYFKGAWVSSHREERFGNYLLSLSNKITNLDSTVFIGFQQNDRRWRGLQTAIPLNKKTPNLALVGVPAQIDKMAQKADKLKLVKILQDKGFPCSVLISMHQVDFLQKEVLETLGTPNLSDHWWGVGRVQSDHQVNLEAKIQSLDVDPNLFQVVSGSSNQNVIAKIIQSNILPFYKEPMPQNPSYRSEATGVRVELDRRTDQEYKQRLEKINNKLSPARGHHGSMHCVRVSLWTQVFSKTYEKFGRTKIDNPILLATAGAIHDVAREHEGIDYWDDESSEVLDKFFDHASLNKKEAQPYIQAVREKDPKKGEFSSDVQRILHDADCLDIIRVIGKGNFNRNYLCLYHFEETQKGFCDQIIDEMADFINITENIEIRNYLEHFSDDFYGDLVRLLFVLNKEDESRFKSIALLIGDDMHGIIDTTSIEATERLRKILQLISAKN